jgi:hypothetical protein
MGTKFMYSLGLRSVDACMPNKPFQRLSLSLNQIPVQTIKSTIAHVLVARVAKS